MIKLYSLVKDRWWQLLIIVLLVAGQTFLQLQLPDYIKNINNIINNANISPGGRISSTDLAKIGLVGLEMIGISALAFLLAAGQALTNSNFVARFGCVVREKIFLTVEEYSLSDLNEFGTASLLTRVTNDTRNLQNFMFMTNRVFVMAPVFLVIGSSKLLSLNISYFYVVTVALPLVVILMVITFFIASPMFSRIQKNTDYVTLLFREGLTGVRVVRAFNQEDRENSYFEEANEQLTTSVVKVNRLMNIVNPFIGIIFNFAYISIYFVGFFIISKLMIGSASPEAISDSLSETMAASMYLQHIMMSFLMLSFTFIMFPHAAASAKRINSVLAVTPTVVDKEETKDKSLITKGNVKFNDVTFTFSENAHPTLENITFTAKPGTITAIVGSTGSGKSSIINLLPRFFDVTTGEITIDGHDIRDFKIDDLRDHIGFVPQTAILFSGTIRDNLRFGKEDATEEEMIAALKVAQAYDFVMRNELGLDAPVAQSGRNFSGGQKQRLSIARALVRKPKIYVFDDSFSALDYRTDIRLRSELSSYAKDATIFVVAQRVSSILDASQILVLDDGKIVGLGTHGELLQKCKVYQEIVASQLDPDEIQKSRDLVLEVEGK